ncbi:hypothetical protein [Fimbriimonas ginsengisoli]|uniref:3-keto-disaccharide hydrolase domain-containing protein n=1 Tax=Fimbriimonas ginsengisoli Gsoil 348 TaxID=661478 RepID=A0A068NR21_FIMGI|nr:hypothetical protein [Fimbriimonas ginsengisoli]AIE85832.1 hypothetical protein OP10G_2464 [Fimbriimonas ginsengisoli Gsoil 348]
MTFACLLLARLLSAQEPLAAPLPEGNVGLASKYPGDRGIEKDPAVIFRDDFEVGLPQDRWDNVFQKETVQIATAKENVHGGSRSIEMTVPKQRQEKSNAVVKDLKGYDTVFLRVYSKFDPDFDQIGSSHNGLYLAAISPNISYSTPGIKADGKNKFVASFECWRGDPSTGSPGGLNVYCYHPEMRSDYGDHFFPSGLVLPSTYLKGNFGPNFLPRLDIAPKLGEWQCYELMMKANTPGRRDGRIACWLDGKLVADFPNLRLRDVDTLKINHASLDLHIGDNSIRSNRKWYDDVVIATSYIGPMGG